MQVLEKVKLKMNKIKQFINKFFWNKVSLSSKFFNEIYSRTHNPFKGVVANTNDETINVSFTKQSDYYEHSEFIYKLHSYNYKIEASNLFVIKGFRSIVKESIYYERMNPNLVHFLNHT